MQVMADFLVAHLGHGNTPAECTPEAESLRLSAASSAHFASAFTHSLGEWAPVHCVRSPTRGKQSIIVVHLYR